MTKYGVTLYPNNESDYYEIEANSIEEAIEEAESIVSCNSFFVANEGDVEIIEDEVNKNE